MIRHYDCIQDRMISRIDVLYGTAPLYGHHFDYDQVLTVEHTTEPPPFHPVPISTRQIVIWPPPGNRQ